MLYSHKNTHQQPTKFNNSISFLSFLLLFFFTLRIHGRVCDGNTEEIGRHDIARIRRMSIAFLFLLFISQAGVDALRIWNKFAMRYAQKHHWRKLHAGASIFPNNSIIGIAYDEQTIMCPEDIHKVAGIFLFDIKEGAIGDIANASWMVAVVHALPIVQGTT